MINMANNADIVRIHDIYPDNEYIKWLSEIKERFVKVHTNIAVKANAELIFFYWQLGRDIVLRKAEEKWGSGIVEKLSLDLKNAFPNTKGFSSTNLWYMKKWYLFYCGADMSGHGLNLSSINANAEKLHQLGGETHSTELLSCNAGTDFPYCFAFVPWRHHIEIITKCHTKEKALFYIKKSIEESLSRRALINYIEAGLYENTGKAITNFKINLPEKQSRLAQEITKGTYDLGFISLPAEYDEKDLEEALEKNITRFLLELGKGFAFVGRQQEIIVAGKTKRIDMLFYHIRLKCYIVIELKTTSFEPEFAGKLNFYVNAVNSIIKTEHENPTIGLLICKGADKTEVQLAFQGITTPLGIAAYKNVQIKELENNLPTSEQIQNCIKLAEEEYRLKKQL